MPSGETLEQHNTNSPKKRYNGQKRSSRHVPLAGRAMATKLNQGIPASQNTTDSGTEDETPMAMFQQFCASCERQMTVRNPSILYCSDRCRRQDSATSQSLPLFKTDISPPPSPYQTPSFEDSMPRDIIPQMSPTVPTMSSLTYFSYKDNFLPQVTVDTIAASATVDRPTMERRDSEAARFLATFNSENSDRPYYTRRGSGTPAAPSLSTSFTPVSSTSAMTPYTPLESPSSSRRNNQRPRTNPRWSSTSFSNRSVDLITPISHSTSLLTISDINPAKHSYKAYAAERAITAEWPVDSEEHLAYAKRVGLDTTTSPQGRGSLKQLFRFDEMRSTPSIMATRRKSTDTVT